MTAAETILCHNRFGNHPEAPAIELMLKKSPLGGFLLYLN